MIYISHRGNISGKNLKSENNPEYIENALNIGFDVEIDIWSIKDRLFLGHEEPVYPISSKWIFKKRKKLWVHCKNIESIEYFINYKRKVNFFWHQEDTLTITSKGFIWAYPGKQPIKNSIAVLPEVYNDDLSKCFGICSDLLINYIK